MTLSECCMQIQPLDEMAMQAANSIGISSQSVP